MQYVETTRSKVVLGSEIDGDDLRTFSDDPIITGPVVCQFGGARTPLLVRAWLVFEDSRPVLVLD